MPSRFTILFIVLFWLLVAGWFVARDIAPLWQTGESPPYHIGMADEAMRQIVPIRWRVVRGDEAIAVVKTSLSYNDKDDTSDFIAECVELPLYSATLPIAGRIEITARNYRDVLRVTRDGELRAMDTNVELAVRTGSSPEFTGRAELSAVVRDRQLHRRFTLRSAAFGTFSPDLEPTDPPRGSVLNPMHPIPRLEGLVPGQRWRQRLVAPHEEILQAALAKLPGAPSGAFASPAPRYLTAEVLSTTSLIAWDGRDRECFIVEYRNPADDSFLARTYVQQSDGSILRQEATSHGETLVLQRE